MVSIIIPVYNSASLLAATIVSAIQQTYAEKEIIIVDDGSTDGGFEIAKKYESPTVKVIQQSNAGAAAARNTGLAVAKGEFIQFLDAGDIIDPEKIVVQVNTLLLNPGKVAVCNYKQFTTEEDLKDDNFPDQSSFIYSSEYPQDFLINLWGGRGKMNFIQTNSWLLPRSILSRVGKWRNYRCPDDDGEFFARVLLASEGIVYTPGVYNYYHISHRGVNQLSRSTNYKYQMNTLLTIDLKHRYLLSYGPHPLLNKAIAAQYFRFAVDMYPARKILSAIAWKRFKELGEKPPQLRLGGFVIQLMYSLFGWRTARIIRYYLRRS